MATNLRGCWMVGVAIACNAAAQERSSQGSQLKTAPPARSTLTPPAPASKPAPAPARSGLAPPAPASTPAPPVITTATIRLLGGSGDKQQAKLPTVIATQGLQLWGAAAPGGAVKTASLVLLGAATGSSAAVATQGLQLWGAAAPGGSVKTASLVLLGPAQGSIGAVATEPIRLWGLQ